MKIKTLTVTQINNYISSYVLANPIFSSLCIEGEIFNVKKTAYGYTFLSLKDSESKISCIIFENQFEFDDKEFKEGDYVLAYGKINFYKKQGTYSIIINRLEKKGSGQSYEQLKKLYEKFEKLGYFASEHKKSIPKYPDSIGIVTSLKGAAKKDILSVIKRKYPKVTVLVYSSKMQGDDVAEKVIEGIKYLNAMEVDTIIISRGGGDSDDLGIFNDESIVKAIYDSDVPVISAIGHEIDFVLSDFVSDMRAPTPSVAGELSVPSVENVYETIDGLKNKIDINFKNVLNEKQLELENLQYRVKNNSPGHKISDFIIRINDDKNKIQRIFTEKLRNYEKRILYIDSVLSENNISKMLSKGYNIAKKDGKIVNVVGGLKSGDILTLCFSDGTAQVEVKKIGKREDDGKIK